MTSEQWLNITRFFIDKSKLQNTKNASSLVYGVDIDAVISVKRKIRETYSSNLDKIQLGKVDYKNYCSCFTLNEFLDLMEYPFSEAIDDVKTPKKYLSFKLPKELISISLNYVPKTESTIEKRKTDIAAKDIVYSKIPKNLKGIAQQLSKCPAYWSMLKKENADWYERNFLVKWLKYGLKLNEGQILWLIDKYSGWSDYDPKITAFYVHKHFIEGTAETKFKAPVRKKVLMKYGNCKNDCETCVYYDRFFG
nr:hypothetical protein [Candidatus Woesearchaeota archaeon]